MARKLQRFALSKKTNAGFCLGAIFMPILSSILTVSCGVYYNTDRERKFEERFKFFDFKLYEGKINKILRWTGTLERLSHKYKWFNADPEFKKRFKDVFFNFVKLINSFTYAANKEYPNIEDEYLSYLIYTIRSFDSFYSNKIQNSKVVNEYNSKLTYKALTPGNIRYFSGLKYMNHLWNNKFKNDSTNLKRSEFKNLSAFLSKDVYENSVKLVSFTKRERAIRLSEYTNDNNEETYKTYDIRPRNYDPWNSYIENYKYAEDLPKINNTVLINNHRKFGIFDVKKEVLIINSKKINALTFKFNKLYNFDDISVMATLNKNESRDLLNYIDINFAYRPKLMSFREFFEFVKKIKFRKNNLLESEIGTGYIDLDKLLEPVNKLMPNKFNVFKINTYDFGKFTLGNLYSTATGGYGQWNNGKYDKNIFLDYINFFKLDPNTNNTELFITPDSWDINEISKKDWDEMLPGILKSLEGFL
nr:hypothetical protein MBKG4397_2070 [Mycoplasmopsis bovis]